MIKCFKYRIGWLLLLVLAMTSGCGSNKYLPNKKPLAPPPFYVPEQIRVALVLGSGGIRGTAHVGVLEVLEAEGIPIDLLVGCSAGSIVGSLYAATPCVNMIKSDVWNIRSDSLLEINLFECRYGLSQGSYIRNMLEKQLSCKQFRDLKIPLVVVASDLYTGELIPMGAGNLVKSVQASCSIPFVFTPCKYMGRILVDGGVINPVPARVAKDLGADVIIAVDLCELLPKTCPSNLFEIASRSAEIAFMWQNQVCTRYADVVIRPKTCGIGTFNDNMKWVLYEAGKRAAREQLPKIRKIMAERCHNACQQKKWKLVHLPPYTPQIYQDP